jgi:acyl-CoA synthetase (AMP-forming)/AMP-acid ligase II
VLEHFLGRIEEHQPVLQAIEHLDDEGSRRAAKEAEAAVLAGEELGPLHGIPMTGYHRDPDATAATLLADGWLRTGDLTVMDERGYCRIVGRLKDMIIRGGENLFPAEIEDVLHRHAAVADVAVVGVPDDIWGEVVAAFIRPTDPARPPTVAELHDHARSHLSPQKTPALWYLVESFPLTGSGKVQKNVMRDAWIRGDLRKPLPAGQSRADSRGEVDGVRDG